MITVTVCLPFSFHCPFNSICMFDVFHSPKLMKIKFFMVEGKIHLRNTKKADTQNI